MLPFFVLHYYNIGEIMDKQQFEGFVNHATWQTAMEIELDDYIWHNATEQMEKYKDVESLGSALKELVCHRVAQYTYRWDWDGMHPLIQDYVRECLQRQVDWDQIASKLLAGNFVKRSS